MNPLRAVPDEPEPGPSDQDIVNVVAEHLSNVAVALASAGVPTRKTFECAVIALTALDAQAAEAEVDATVVSPAHRMALVALGQLETALRTMKVKTPERIEGFGLDEMFAQLLSGARGAVADHEKMLNAKARSNRPALFLPNGTMI